MVRIPYLKAHGPKGGPIYYYYRRDGQSQRIYGEFGSDEWWANYKAINATFRDTGSVIGIRPDSLEAVSRLYLASDRYLSLKPSTRTDYRRVIDDLRSKLGEAPIASLTRKVIVQLRDRIAKKHPRKAMIYVTVIKVLIECAMDHGLADANPAKDISKPAGYKAEPHRPWTEDELNTFIRGAKDIWRRALIVLLYTGLRREDALQLQRSHIKDGLIRWVPSKTDRLDDEPVVIPIHSALAEELARPMEVTSLYLIQGIRGGAVDKSRLTHKIREECLRLGIKDPATPHGLRKNAVRMLSEVGCTVEEINAITGQSEQMIKHYRRGFDRTRLAKGALLKWEQKSNTPADTVSKGVSKDREKK